MITSALYLVLPGAAIVAAMMLFFGASTSRLGPMVDVGRAEGLACSLRSRNHGLSLEPAPRHLLDVRQRVRATEGITKASRVFGRAAKLTDLFALVRRTWREIQRITLVSGHRR